MLNAVDDPVRVIRENNIAVLTHELYDQILPAEITHLIQMLDFDTKNTLQTGLCYT